MRKKWIQIGCVGVMMVSAMLSACGPSSQYEDMELTSDVQSIVCFDTEVLERDGFTAVQEFGISLLKEQLAELNPVVSPASAYIALAMTGDGAKGNTRQEFLDILGENGEMTLLSEEMMASLPRDNDGLEVLLADSIWIDDEFVVNKEWLANIESVYDAHVFQADLKTDKVMVAMNQWISNQTRELIKNMVEKPLDADARLVLFNTVYFNGMWETEFEASDTREDYFYIASDEAGKMPMMHQYGNSYEYIESAELEGCVLPYKGGEYAFVAWMPKNAMENIHDYMVDFSVEDLQELMGERQSCRLDLMLPKFEVRYGKKLNDSLKNMGLVDAFDSSLADFSGMGESKAGLPICIGEVLQKSVIRVDEKGTEAAAATEVVMVEECAMELIEEPKKLYFNRPFFYMIMDMKNQIPLFMGVMDNPKLAEVSDDDFK